MKSFKKFIKGNLFESIILAAIGFVCGYFVDSVLFHINPLFCAIIEAELLGMIGYCFLCKNGGRL